MKHIKSNLFVVTLFVCLSTKYASALKCYDCDNDHYDSDCQVTSTTRTMECPASKNSVCRTFTIRDPKFTYIRRSCGILQMESLVEFSSPTGIRLVREGTPVNFMFCNTDLCNEANSNQQLTTKLILFLSAITFISMVLV